MTHVDWGSVLLAGGASLAGYGSLALSSWWSPAARRSGKRAHFLLGFALNGIGMLLIGAGWARLALLPPKLDFPFLTWLGVAAVVLGGALYVVSASRVGRLRALSRYSIDLDVSGVYSIVRHPQALALSLLAVGLGGLSQSLPYLVLLPLWIALWYLYCWIEEALELRPVFGNRYREYARATPRMFPSHGSLAAGTVERVTLFRSVPDSTRSSRRR